MLLVGRNTGLIGSDPEACDDATREGGGNLAGRAVTDWQIIYPLISGPAFASTCFLLSGLSNDRRSPGAGDRSRVSAKLRMSTWLAPPAANALDTYGQIRSSALLSQPGCALEVTT